MHEFSILVDLIVIVVDITLIVAIVKGWKK